MDNQRVLDGLILPQLRGQVEPGPGSSALFSGKRHFQLLDGRPGHGGRELDGLGVVVHDHDQRVVKVLDAGVHQVDGGNLRPEALQNVVLVPRCSIVNFFKDKLSQRETTMKLSDAQHICSATKAL